MPLKKSDLYSTIWQSCDALRGGMDASQYKNYVLTILFVKYISDKYANAGPYADIKVPQGASFSDMVALKGSANIGDDINKKILGPIAEANRLSKADLADFDDAALLGDGKEKVDRLTDLISIFQDHALDFSKNRADGDDILGDAYEYLMRHFATESGKSKGQFYTPSEVSRIMAALVGIAEAATSGSTSVYDPTCGSGSLLLKVADAAPTAVTLYGQEKDVATAGLARMNMILHNNPGAVIEGGASTIANPKFTDGDGTLKTFDYVVANPPFSDKRWGQGIKPADDPHHRFAPYGVPPPKQGDYAYLLHIIRSLKSTGQGACILPHGVLFRGNAEADIRKNLVERGIIKAIIGLPPNLFYGTGIPACIVVLDKAGAAARQGIFLVDASAGFKKEGPKNRLREMDIHRIVDVCAKQDTVPGFARMVPLDEIQRNNHNLNIPRYIDGRAAEDIQDIEGHLRGGIPVRDVEALNAYWAVCPGLRKALFKPDRAGYVDLAIERPAIRAAIAEHAEFKHYGSGMEAHFAAWRTPVVQQLKALDKDLHPKQVVRDLGEALLAHYTGQPLVNAYDVYQLFMDYAEEVLRDDLYLLSEVGWASAAQVRELQKVRVKKDDGEKLAWAEEHDYAIGKRRFKSDLIPGSLVVARFFAKEQAGLDALALHAETLAAQLAELEEEHGGDEGLYSELDKVNKGTVGARLKEVKDDPDAADERAALQAWLDLNTAEAKAKKQLKQAQEQLTVLVHAKYPTLTRAEVKTLVVEDKWMGALGSALHGELDRTGQRLTGRVAELAERYGRPLPALAHAVEALSAKVEAHLKQMDLAWN